MDLFSAIAVSAGFAALGVIMARRRGRSGLVWGVLGALFPLILIILLLMPRANRIEGA